MYSLQCYSNAFHCSFIDLTVKLKIIYKADEDVRPTSQNSMPRSLLIRTVAG